MISLKKWKMFNKNYFNILDYCVKTFFLFRYVELHNIYRERANQDAESVYKYVVQFLESNNRSRYL